MAVEYNHRMISKKAKVFVAMSGGVDSSVSAALLKKAGYDVTGVFIKVWMPDWIHCTWKEDRRDAMRVAAVLDIPFLTFDLEKEYKKEVVDYMISEYRSGRTPNPDVMCNQQIKFGSFFKKAKKAGANFIATGHYAQIKKSKDDFELYEGKDKNKDQSYFLWGLSQNELKHVLFPVGHLQKDTVRKLAHQFKLPNADKKDSQGLCFIGKIEMREFLNHFIKEKQGKVLDEKGKVIGNHPGAFFFTIGQRHGFKINKKTPTDQPYYIVSKDVKRNLLVVSNRTKIRERLAKKECFISNTNWINSDFLRYIEKNTEGKLLARIRYRQEKQQCHLEKVNKNKFKVIFDRPQEGLAAGQSLVLYDKERCLGGGIIMK